MPARLDSAVRATAAGLGLCGAAALALPWWTAEAPVLLAPGAPVLAVDVWRGAAVLGLAATVLVAALAVGAALAVLFAPVLPARLALGAAGAGLVAAGAVVLAGWGPTSAPGAWLTAAAGVLVLAGASGRPLLPVLLAAAVAAALVVAVPGPLAAPGRSGAWTRLAAVSPEPPRSGPAAPPDGPARLGTVAGGTAVATGTAIIRIDDSGLAQVVARTDVTGEILGIAGDRVAQRVAADRVRVTSLRAGDPVDLEIHAVTAAGPVGPDGALWLRAAGDPPATVRLLDLRLHHGRQQIPATYLPVLVIGFPPGAAPLRLEETVPLGQTGLRIVGRPSGARLERIEPTPTAARVDLLAGGADPTCGLTRTARDAHLEGATAPPVPAPDGGTWLATATRLVRVAPDGTLQVAADPLPGPVTALHVTPAGDVDVLVAGPAAGLWRLPAAATTLLDPPPTPTCVPHPPRAGPPIAFVPVGTTGAERHGTPLSVTGAWVSRARSEVALVSGGTRVVLGRRDDPEPGPVVPDGSGGVWWLERVAAGQGALVHARPGSPPERFPPVPVGEDTLLVPDLGGRAPLLASASGLAGAVPDAVARALTGPVTAGVVRADGRGWFLADGRLVTTDGTTGTTVVDAGDRRADPTPAAVQLARGVPPSELALPGAHLVLDGAGRPVVVCADGVVLRADPATGAVVVIAHDELLVAPTTVEGGVVQNTDGTLQRVDLPG
ncbi:hypothetical protein [Pseudonocardia thermophila]|uniref:hypothetical protein n=1 Tax=Pseudonocardia thermophila TaxID=1848 RepID=UPI00248D49A5|nr:hypothetical protein [Pseudonocardia thermophila]